MKKLFFLLLLITTPAFACSKEEIQNQRIAATADTTCMLTEVGAIKKDIGDEIFKKKPLEEARKDYGTERLAKVTKLMRLQYK